MTAHELARKLLDGPDLTVVVNDFCIEGEKTECTDIEVNNDSGASFGFNTESGYVTKEHVFLG